MNQIQPIPAQPVEARRVGLTVGHLRKLIERLPNDMDVRFCANGDGEFHVMFAETYKDNRGGTLMLSDADTQGARSTIIYDATEE
jgi:hypothetical protein